MRKPTLREVVLLLTVGIAIGWWSPNRPVAAQSTPTYRVIGTSSDKTMEREINEAARQGCEPVLGVGGSSISGEAMVLLRCPS